MDWDSINSFIYKVIHHTSVEAIIFVIPEVGDYNI